MTHNQTCRANHMGIWAVEPLWFQKTVSAVERGILKAAAGEPSNAEPIYQTIDGVAAIPIMDFMMKGQSKYGGTSTVRTRQAIRAANRDESVKSILLHIDSPGGHHFGTDELATEVRKSQKPVVSFIEDTGASAAYWVASAVAPGRVFANRTAEVGSIGTFAVLEDTSKAAEAHGVSVHVVSTGPMKGAGVDGTPITDEVLSEVQIAVNRAFGFFADSVKTGRGMGAKEFAAVSDGRMFGAKDAKELGLIDGITTLEGALNKAKELGRAQSARNRSTSLRIKSALDTVETF